jgi:hypothetical protein
MNVHHVSSVNTPALRVIRAELCSNETSLHQKIGAMANAIAP